MSRLDLSSKSEYSLNSKKYEEIEKLCGLFPQVDLMANQINVLHGPDGLPLQYFSNQVNCADDPNCIGGNFFTVDLETLDKTVLYWIYPPDFSKLTVLYKAMKARIPALIMLVSSIDQPWMVDVQCKEAKIWHLANPWDWNVLSLNNKPVRPGKNVYVVVTKPAIELAKRNKHTFSTSFLAED